MKSNNRWEALKNYIEDRRNFVLTTHVSPDGDALGSEVALARLLTNMGKKCTIINMSGTSQNYRFLDHKNKIIKYDEKQHLEILSNTDGIFILDLSDWARLRDIGKVIQELNLSRVCIDHHLPTDKMADIEIIDPKASCTGELLYEFMEYLNAPMDTVIAEALYTCLLTDTGSFRFSNTSSRVHAITAELFKAGIKARDIYENVYETWSKAKVKLNGDVLANMNYECDGKLAWFCITRKMLRSSGVKNWELETFPEMPKMIAGVEVGLMFTELDKERTKISIRSKSRVPINTIAEMFGGGGHKYAAGAAADGSLEVIIEKVLNETCRAIKDYFKPNDL